ncbi:MAG TPA: peptidylprolyl isomerase [Candidatus Kapabacteria bacterium]|nr:peptidylprolyl isomerase [Candidatus Kapabacteria bacterium]
MKLKIALLVGLAISLNFINLSAQTNVNNIDETVVLEVGKEKITAKELQNAYKKNLNRKNDNLFALPKDTILDFIKLYSNFRLKVNDAEKRGFDKDPDVMADIKQNRKILSETFYYDKKLTDKWVDYLLNQRNKEYKVGIILIPIQYNPQPDTLTAFNKITEALKELKAGIAFESVARTHSEDKETARNGGIIPQYITSGKVQRPIEMAIFNTPKGSFYPEPIKTNFGYFIIKVLDVADRMLVDGSHILISMNELRDSASAYKKADSVLKLIKNGADFAKMAKENSDDAKTAPNGGALGELYSRATGLATTSYPLVKEFETTLYQLKDGEVSGVVKTEFGFHIIKRNHSSKPDLEKERIDLRKAYKRLYFEDDKHAMLDSLKETYGFKINDNTLNQAIANLDTNQTTLKANWSESIDKSLYSKTLFSILNKDYTLEFFLDKLQKQADLKGVPTNKEGFTKAIGIITNPIAFDKASENLEHEYPDFRELMREFSDGILLFKVEAIEVWDKLKFDSTQARHFFDTLSKKFYTDDMYDITEIFLLNDSNSKSIYEKIKAGADIEAIAQKETQREGYREKMGKWGLLSVKSNNLAKHAFEAKAKKGDVLEPFKNGTGFSIIKINDYQAPRPKKFEEAISDIAPLFQESLQKELLDNWLNKLKKEFPIKIIDKNLVQVIKNK